MSKRKFTNFKIFAIQPLNGCGDNILKVLKEDEIYYLFNDYQVDSDGKLSYKRSYPANLYYIFKLHFIDPVMSVCFAAVADLC